MQLQGTKITVNFLLQLSLLRVPVSPGMSVSIRAESRKLVFHSTRPQGFHLIHCHFPIGLSTVLSTLKVFTDILVRFTHTGSSHILSFPPSFPIHSPFSIFFLFLRLNISNTVLVPHTQSWRWRRQSPASIHIFVAPSRSIQGTDSLSWSAALPNSHSPSLIAPLYHQGPLGPSSVHRTMWKSNLHLPWQAKWERRQEGARVCKWPWDSEPWDFLWAGSVETGVAGDTGQGVHVTDTPLPQNFPNQAWEDNSDHLYATDFSLDKTELRRFKKLQAVPYKKALEVISVDPLRRASLGTS